MDHQDRVPRHNDGPVHVGDLVLLSTKDLVTLKNQTACPRVSTRFVGPFKVVQPPPSEPAENLGRSKNYVWALPITLGAIKQPLNLSRLRRFVERPAHFGVTSEELTTFCRSFSSPRTWVATAANTLKRPTSRNSRSYASATSWSSNLQPTTSLRTTKPSFSPDQGRSTCTTPSRRARSLCTWL